MVESWNRHTVDSVLNSGVDEEAIAYKLQVRLRKKMTENSRTLTDLYGVQVTLLV